MSSSRDDLQWRAALKQQLAARIAGKAKPPGSLGRLEDIAIQIGMVSGTLVPDLGSAKIVVFAGDHGLTAEGVTAYPSEITREVAKLILDDSAGISICARGVDAEVILVDAGMLRPLSPHAKLLDRRIGAGTKNARREPAMTQEQCNKAFTEGRALVANLIKDGAGIFAFGEIGIGNTSAAALIAHVIEGLPLEALVGPGAGVPPLGLEHKRQVLAETLACAPIREQHGPKRIFEILRQFAGFEMVMMAGAIVAAAAAGRIIIVDGYIATSVLIAARRLSPDCLDNCVFAHTSAEPAHRLLLDHLGAKPLFDFGMRLGEGTGAAFAIPVVRAAEALLSEMADIPAAKPA